MVKESSEASRYDLDVDPSASVPDEGSTPSWDQQTLFGSVHVIIQPQFVVDAAAGSMAVSVTVREFWSGDRLACEVNPALRFPADMPVALAWIEQRCMFFASQLSPF
jgi:hypothetical protein